MRVLGKISPEGAGTRLAVEQAEDMSRHLVEARSVRQLVLDVRREAVKHIEPRWRRVVGTEQRAIDLGHEIGIGIGGASEHYAVHLAEMRRRAGERIDPAIQHDLELGAACLQA